MKKENQIEMLVEPQNNNGLAIVSFATSLAGLLLSLTGIGAILGIPAMITGIVLGIIALNKKQHLKGLSIAAICISSISILLMSIALVNIVKVAGPIIDAGRLIENQIDKDPELKELMNNPEFKKTFNENFKKRLESREFELEQISSSKTGSLYNISEELAKIMSEETTNTIIETKNQFKK